MVPRRASKIHPQTQNHRIWDHGVANIVAIFTINENGKMNAHPIVNKWWANDARQIPSGHRSGQTRMGFQARLPTALQTSECLKIIQPIYIISPIYSECINSVCIRAPEPAIEFCLLSMWAKQATEWGHYMESIKEKIWGLVFQSSKPGYGYVISLLLILRGIHSMSRRLPCRKQAAGYGLQVLHFTPCLHNMDDKLIISKPLYSVPS